MTFKKLLLLTALAGCGGDDSTDSTDSTDDSMVEEGPVYVMMTQVYTTDDREIYFNTSDTLDITSVDFATANKEFGVANFTTLGGKLYVSAGEEPKITQYNVLADRSLEETGEISFGAYPLGDNANFYYHLIVDENLAYLPYENNKRVAWNPSTMQILADKDTSTVPAMDGALLLNIGGNRTAVKFPTGPVSQPFFYTDENWEAFAPNSKIATYDKTSHDEASVQDVACAGLTLTTRAENGDTYFSTNAVSPVKALYDMGAAPCVAKMSAAGALSVVDLTTMTGGRHTMGFRYLANGIGIAHVLHDEDMDLTQPYGPAAEEASYAHYKLWIFDLNANTAKEVTGITTNSPPSQHAVIDGRMFLFGVSDDYASTTVFELSAAGVATTKFTVAGDVFKWERLR
jgi:hypothetical protein